MPVGTAGACRRIQLMVRLTDIDSYAIGGRRNAHCTLTVCEGEHAVRVRYRAVDRAFAAQRNVGNAADSSEIRIPHQTGIRHRRIIVLDHNIAVILRADTQIDQIPAALIHSAAALHGQMRCPIEHHRHLRTRYLGKRIDLSFRAADHLSTDQCTDGRLRVIGNPARIREAAHRTGAQFERRAVNRAFEEHHCVLTGHALLRLKLTGRGARRYAEGFRRDNRLAVIGAARHIDKRAVRIDLTIVERFTHAIGAVEHNDEVRSGNGVARIKQMGSAALDHACNGKRINLAGSPRVLSCCIIKVNRVFRKIRIRLHGVRAQCIGCRDRAYDHRNRQHRNGHQLSRSFHNILLAQWL